MTAAYEAGVYEQCMHDVCDCGGWHPKARSRHGTVHLAAAAARRYRRELERHGPSTGGSMTWSAWYEDHAGRRVDEVDPYSPCHLCTERRGVIVLACECGAIVEVCDECRDCLPPCPDLHQSAGGGGVR